MERDEDLYRKLSAPLMVQLELTPRCNHRCVHCYNHWRCEDRKVREPRPNRLDTVLAELTRAGVYWAVLTGGEPLLARGLLYRAMEHFRRSGTYFTVNSNLTLLTPRDADRFRGLGCGGVLTSLLGDTPELHDSLTGVPGSFGRLVSGVRLLREKGVAVGVNMVVNARNRHAVRATGRLAASFGARTFCATKASAPLSGIDFSELALTREQVLVSLEDLEAVGCETGIETDALECYPLCLLTTSPGLHRYGIRSCRAGISACAVTAAGELRACAHGDEVSGNVAEEGLLAAWDRLGPWRSGELLPQECLGCAALAECSGGCRMEAKCRGDVRGRDSYMTEPLSVPPVPRSVEEPVRSNTPCAILDGLRYRPESFGAVLGRTNTPSALPVNTDALALVSWLASLPVFTPRSAAEAKGLDADRMLAFVRRLERAGLCRGEV